MSLPALKVLLASANCTCLPFLVVVSQALSSVSAAPVGEVQNQWVSNADELVEELLDLARNGREMDEPNLSNDSDMIRAVASSIGGQRLTNLRRADRILWRLWLTTGMAPVVRGQEKPLRLWLEENALAYRQYVTRHADLTEEQLHRMGIAKTAASLGSPLWHMTMRYLTEKAGVEFTSKTVIHVVPYHFLVEAELTAESYVSLTSAMSHWLDMNTERMIWDSQKVRFRPRDGTYLGMEGLSDAIRQTLPVRQEQGTRLQADGAAD